MEAVWLRDCVPLAGRGELSIDRPKALKALLLTALLGALDFGLELAVTFRRANLITTEELDALRVPEACKLPLDGDARAEWLERLVSLPALLLPRRARRIVARGLERSLQTPHARTVAPLE